MSEQPDTSPTTADEMSPSDGTATGYGSPGGPDADEVEVVPPGAETGTDEVSDADADADADADTDADTEANDGEKD